VVIVVYVQYDGHQKTLPILEYCNEWLCNVKDIGSDPVTHQQCCGFRDEKTGSGIRDVHPGSYFRELDDNILGKNTLKFCCGSGIRCLFDAGSGMEKFGSRINIPDPQHCTSALKTGSGSAHERAADPQHCTRTITQLH
jgi:hypothetical protein